MKNVILVGHSLPSLGRRREVARRLEKTHGCKVTALLNCDEELHNIRQWWVSPLKRAVTFAAFPGLKLLRCSDISAGGAYDGATFVIPDFELYETMETILLQRVSKDSHIYIYHFAQDTLTEREYYRDRPAATNVSYHIAWRCNLRCKACFHWSNLYRGKTLCDIERFKRDVTRMNELFEMKCLSILGGEPLLNPQAGEFAAAARSILPKAKIRIVTNGLLIPKMPESLFRTMRENDVSFYITSYPPTRTVKDEIVRILEENGIDYFFTPPQDTFYTYFSQQEHDPAKSFQKCYFWECWSVWDGKLSACGLPIYYQQTEEWLPFKREVAPEDLIDIYEAKDGYEVLEKLSRETPFCKYCDTSKRVDIPWEGNYTEVFPPCG